MSKVKNLILVFVLILITGVYAQYPGTFNSKKHALLYSAAVLPQDTAWYQVTGVFTQGYDSGTELIISEDDKDITGGTNWNPFEEIEEGYGLNGSSAGWFLCFSENNNGVQLNSEYITNIESSIGEYDSLVVSCWMRRITSNSSESMQVYLTSPISNTLYPYSINFLANTNWQKFEFKGYGGIDQSTGFTLEIHNTDLYTENVMFDSPSILWKRLMPNVFNLNLGTEPTVIKYGGNILLRQNDSLWNVTEGYWDWSDSILYMNLGRTLSIDSLEIGLLNISFIGLDQSPTHCYDDGTELILSEFDLDVSGDGNWSGFDEVGDGYGISGGAGGRKQIRGTGTYSWLLNTPYFTDIQNDISSTDSVVSSFWLRRDFVGGDLTFDAYFASPVIDTIPLPALNFPYDSGSWKYFEYGGTGTYVHYPIQINLEVIGNSSEEGFVYFDSPSLKWKIPNSAYRVEVAAEPYSVNYAGSLLQRQHDSNNNISQGYWNWNKGILYLNIGREVDVDSLKYATNYSRVWRKEVPGGTSDLQTYFITKNIKGRGTITLTPELALYDSASIVGVTAAPNNGWTFTGWSGDLSGALTNTSIYMDGDKSITANFDSIIPPPTQFTLNIYSQGNGTVIKIPNQGSYDTASVVTINANPSIGHSFMLWRGSKYSEVDEDTIIMNSNKTIYCKFIKNVPNYRVLISDYTAWNPHAADIKSAFIQGYESAGGTWDDSIHLFYDRPLQDALLAADSNGARMVIRSSTGMQSSISLANAYYPTYLFMPTGMNKDTLLWNSGGSLPSLIVTGAGTTENKTASDIEFYGLDPIGTNLSSYSNGYIAGQLLYIADQTNGDLWTARYLARSAGLTWSRDDGFGKVKINEAIAAYDSQINYKALDIYR